MKVYFDNAATSFPKPEQVVTAMTDYIENIGCNISRGSYEGAYKAGEKVFEARHRIKELFGARDEKNVIFTPSDTYSLNMLIKGILREGDHVVYTSMEHNAVLRPVEALCRQGLITCDIMECDSDGTIGERRFIERLEEIAGNARKMHRNLRAVIMTHGSNVCGSVLPLEAAGRFCRKNDIFLIADCAQTAGICPVNAESMGIDGLAFSGHKGLYGPQGTGGFVLSDKMACELKTVIEGGTGSFSHLYEMPDMLPDRFEAGTMNIPGLYGLEASLAFIEQTGIDRIREHETMLTEAFKEKIGAVEGIRIWGKGCLPVVSVTADQMDPAALAYRLESEFGISTRVGLHCAPAAHKTLGTYPLGTVRFSFGYYNTLEEIEYGAQAIGSICERR